MASAQVLPGSRKQEHLEAGKRRLEEFRKKKAAEKAKKAASSTQNHASDVNVIDKHKLEPEQVRVTDSDGVGTSNGPDPSSIKVIDNNNKSTEVSRESQQVSSNIKHAIPSYLANDENIASMIGEMQAKIQENEKYGVLWKGEPSFNDRLQTKYVANDFQEPMLKESEDFVTKLSPQSSLQSKVGEGSLIGSNRVASSFYEDSTQSTLGTRESVLEVGRKFQGNAEFMEPMTSDIGEIKLTSPSNDFASANGPAIQSSGSSEISFDARNSSSHIPLHSVANDTSSRRSRPSFLDSLNVPRASSGSLFQHNEPTKDAFPSNTSQSDSINAIQSSPFEKLYADSETTGDFSKLRSPDFSRVNEYPAQFSVPDSDNAEPWRPNVANEKILEKQDFYSTKQNEDFAALEQHIEDLTQEKFSLQRALEASRTLAESLAAENSSLTDSYNQQRSVVNQLKSDMEKLREELKAQLAELESFKMEYANAKLECHAADERASILASEVIGLEEKALRLRSNELKLEKQLENSQTEITSFKKKMSSLEKERQDFQSTIEALQEEKKLLQSKLRKASASGKSIDVIKNTAEKKDMSTSTEDLASANATSDDRERNNSNDSLSLLPEDSQLEASSVYIPPDQMRMIQNINSLISELTLEKEELTQAFSSELSRSSRLVELNDDLSRKLEVQTQRLELLTAQSMASGHISARQPESQIMHDNTRYADEGDEVVERVLGWIMKLFPGGPSRRRANMRLSY